ncbi:MAG TPA: D-aminoacylase [Acidimicrobiaceae bacterium]|nr:D-aminoacylase [Acidimicrobiaceae bacterium]
MSTGASFDLVIRGAAVADGLGAPLAIADVAVRGDRIVAVGEVAGRGGVEIDGAGKVLAPGFIDVHTHDDWAVLAEPQHACKVLQGCTSIVVGNCGTSIAPGGEQVVARGGGFESIGAYLEALDNDPASVNTAALVGHGSVRTSVIGLRDNRPATEGELSAMRALVERAMVDGAVGLSSGLIYEPGKYAPEAELVALAGVAAAAGALYTTHMRNEGVGLLDSIAETVRLAEQTGVRVQISHHKASGRGAWGLVTQSLALIDAACAAGLDVMADQYPYTRGSTLLEQIVRAGELHGFGPEGDLTPAQVLIGAAPHHPEWEGRTLTELAEEWGCDGRAAADRVVAEEGRGCIVVLDTMTEADVETVMAHPSTLIGSDGIPLGGKPHPRLHHTFPRVLGHYAREKGVFSLETAISRMTGLSARRFGLADRGEVREGAYADLVLFDPDVIADTGTFTDPTTVPAGIDRVWVNGVCVAADGEHTGARPGRALRFSR